MEIDTTNTDTTDSIEPEVLDIRDPFLLAYTQGLESGKFPLTVIVGGTVMSGTYLDATAYLALLTRRGRERQGRSSDDADDANTVTSDAPSQDGDGAGKPDFLHLRDCRIFGQNDGYFGVDALRIRIMDVQAWMPGEVN